MPQLKTPSMCRREQQQLHSLRQKGHWGAQRARSPISLLCVLFKIFERLTYARVKTIIDPFLPQEHSGFRHKRSTKDQVTLLRHEIEDSSSAKKKVGAVSVDLTAVHLP